MKTCTWWTLGSTSCVRKCSPSGHLNKEWVHCSLCRGSIINAVFSWGVNRMWLCSHLFFLLADKGVSLLRLAARQAAKCPLSTNQSNRLKSMFVITDRVRVVFFHHVCLAKWSKHTFSHVKARCTLTDDHSGGWAANSTILRLLPTFVSLTIKLQSDRRARFSPCVKTLCQTCSRSECTNGPSWSQSSPINNGPISSSHDPGAEKWKAWRCIHFYNQCQGASDMGTLPCLVSLSDQTGGCIIHQTASKWRKDIHHCPPFKLDPTDVAISQTHQYSGPTERLLCRDIPSITTWPSFL